jgi:hypothetical protein
MDVVLLVGTRDCFIARKAIKYIKSNLCADTIYMVTDIRNKKFFSDKFLITYNIVIFDENKLVPGLSFEAVAALFKKRCDWKNYGWYLQQFLKIGFALSPYAKEQYLIWDADTFPLKPLRFYENGKFVITPKTEYHIAYFKTIHKILGLDKMADYSFIAEHMIIDSAIMKKMTYAILQSDVPGTTWYEKIINALDVKDESELSKFAFSEFETYGTFCLKYYPDIFVTRNLKTFREAGKLYGRGVTQKQLQALSEQYDTASFEVRYAPPFPKNIKHWSGTIYLWLIQKLRRKYPNIRF